MRHARHHIIVTAVVTALGAAPASADTFEWSSAVTGNWTDASKWNRLAGTGSAPPGAGDTAIVNENGSSSSAYSIGLMGNVTLDALTATARYANLGSATGQPRRTLSITSGAADLTVNNSNTYFWIGATSVGGAMNVNVGDATSVNNGACLFIGDSQFSTERLLLGTTGGTPSSPSMLLVSAAATLGVNSTSATAIGTAGHGKLDVAGTAIFSGELRVGKSSIADQGGAVEISSGSVSAPTLAIGGGAAASSVGSVYAHGGGDLMLTSSLTVGGAAGTGAGFLEITGARLLSPQTSTTINATGNMLIRSSVDTFFRSDLNVNGGVLTFSGNHNNLTYAPGVDISVKPGGRLSIRGNLTLPAANNVIQPGAEYYHGHSEAAGTETTVTIPAGGALTIDGSANLLCHTFVQGTLNYNPSAYQGDSNTRFSVLDGGQFNAHVQWTPPSAGTLLVAGTGSIYRDLSADGYGLGLNQGWSSANNALLRVEPGGTFQKESGVVEVGQFGRMEIAGGAIVADDITRHASGEFEFAAGHILIDNPLPIGSWSPMPGDMNLGNGRKLQTLATATIEAGRLLQMTGGELRAYSIINNGALQLDAGTLALTGGSYTGPAVTIGANARLAGAGSIDARINGAVGSRIIAEGDLALGEAANAAGFVTGGDINTGAHTVTLRDANAAVLGAMTQLGSPAAAGTLEAANGLLLNTGASLTGFGTVSTPNESARAFIVDGSVTGESAQRNVTLPGYVRGNGSFDDVTFTGTFDPGHNGPAKVVAGDLTFASSSILKADLGGASAGSGFDQIDASNSGVHLGGTLDLTMINNYQPAMLIAHQIIVADTVAGRFNSVDGALLSQTRALAVTYGQEGVYVTATLPGDANLDGLISGDDYSAIDFAVNIPGASGWSNGDFNYDNVISGDDYSIIDFNLVAQNQAIAGATGPATATVVAVPEPIGLLPMLSPVLLLRRRRRNKSRRVPPPTA